MRKMLIAALIVPVALLGAVRPAKAGSDKAAAVLAGVAVGIGAALILDALMPRPVVAPRSSTRRRRRRWCISPRRSSSRHRRRSCRRAAAGGLPDGGHRTPPPVVYRPAPVFVKGPRRPPHVVHKPHPVYVRDRHGRGYWSARYIPDR